MSSTRLIIVVTALRASQANEVAALIDQGGEGDVFTVGLSPNGQEPATRYWCNWQMQEGDAEQIQTLLAPLLARRSVRIFDASQFTPEQVLAELKMKRISVPLP